MKNVTEKQLGVARELFTQDEIHYLFLGAELRRVLVLRLLDALLSEREKPGVERQHSGWGDGYNG